jgi:hypothetical protein
LRANPVEWIATTLGDLGVADANGLETIRLMAVIDGLNVALLTTPDPLDPQLARSVLQAHIAELLER